MSRWFVGLLFVGALGLGGCDKNCQNTCARIYDPSQCDVRIPGVTDEALKRDCFSECESALKQAGEMGDYNPYNLRNPMENPVLENERQAGAWMDCVWSAECEELDPASGICAPI